jgi:hypothetical protein
MTWGLELQPLLPILWIAVLAIAAGLLAFYGVFAGLRGAWLRVGAVAALALALLNPIISREDREPLTSVAALVVDRSQSQALGGRATETDQALEALRRQISALRGIELREITVTPDDESASADGTRLFEALSRGIGDVPPDRFAGAVVVSDGRIHDVPRDMAQLGVAAPVHVLVTGRSTDRDRRVVIDTAPRFGLVNTQAVMSFRVLDAGTPTTGARVSVTVRRDGEVIDTLDVTAGQTTEVSVEIAHGGVNIVEIEAATLEGELTAVNNRAVATIEGIRENLRVLLVSGEPHAGERTWRNLLKSDASVDLVHFTILRPPEKQDGTPINELSLIAFPVRELFQEKIREFDLIIFDRYQRRTILSSIYFDNIARYVRDGGAVLVAAGPDYADQGSLYRTPLSTVLPATPSGQVVEEPFRAAVSELGKRHPVTRGLPGSESDPPRWSRWFRVAEVEPTAGSVVMTGADKPLLILAREGEGRVGLLVSDHVWLWARGYEGGGPHSQLLRRLSHWLMKEPDLEEEALRLTARGRTIEVERQTLGDSVPPVTLTSPTGQTRQVNPLQQEPGRWRVSLPAPELGLWKATDGAYTALVHVGPPNPREWTDVVSSLEPARAITEASDGSIRRIAETGTVAVPRVLSVRSNAATTGMDWIGLKLSDASVLKGVDRLPLFAGLLGLALLLGALSVMWWREGR